MTCTHYGINNSGQVVGYYGDSGNNSHGFLYVGGVFLSFGYPGASFGTIAQAINNNGQIVGIYADSNDVNHDFLYTGGTFIPIDYPGARTTLAYGINDSGQIVGYYRDTSNALRAAAAWSTGPTKARVHTASVGCLFVRTDIGNLNDTLLSVSHFPHGHIGRTALLEVTVMPSRAKPALIGPIASDRSPQFNLTQECYKTLRTRKGKVVIRMRLLTSTVQAVETLCLKKV